MLGKGVTLPGECAWDGATVQETRVVSWYLCSGTRIELELRHPSETDAGVAQTSQFAIRPRGPPPPAGLVDAIAQRVREREAAFVWSGGGEHSLPAPLLSLPPERQTSFAQWLAASLAALVFLAAALWWGRPKPGALAATSPLWVWPVTLGFAAACFGTTRAFGRALWAGLERDPGASLAASTGLMLLCAALAIAAAGLLNVLPSPLPRWARLLAGPTAFLAVGLPLSLSPASPTTLGGLSLGPPNDVQVETRRDRPKVTYRTGPLGFREPGWSPSKPLGTQRIGLIGDSYVFGIGVEEVDTLSASLQAELARRSPSRPVEVINLGIPGANLTTHIDVAEASAPLELDALIICLTLPNDLSRWDAKQAQRQAAQLSSYSLGRFLLGQAADALWELASLDRSTTDAGLAHLDHELSRLAAFRERAEHPPQLWFYSFRDLPSVIATRLAATPGARVIPEGQTFPEDFLPIDGHPTLQGNRRSAGRLADALLQGGN